jgi:hypothetical protein
MFKEGEDSNKKYKDLKVDYKKTKIQICGEDDKN